MFEKIYVYIFFFFLTQIVFCFVVERRLKEVYPENTL